MVVRRTGAPATAQSVIDAAAIVFTEYGYGGATLDRIGSRLGLTRQGVLHHFPSKSAVLFAVLRRERDWADSLSARPITAENARERLLGLRAYTGSTDEGRHHIRLMHVLYGEAIAGNSIALTFAEERQQTISKRITAMFTALEATGQLDERWDAESAGACLVALFHGLQSRALIDPDADVGGLFDRFTATVITPAT